MVRRIIGMVLVMVFVFVSFSFAAEKENKWMKFNAGSWVLYDIGNGLQQKQTLLGKTETGVTLKMEMIMDGRAMPPTEAKISVGHSPTKPTTKVKETPGSLEVKGQAVPCMVYEITTEEGVSKSWIADAVPGGVVQTAIGDKVLMKLVDFEAK